MSKLIAEAERVFRLLTAPLRAMPSIVLAGAPKCGTSTLYDYICAHPDVRRGRRKEPTNFIHFPGSRLQAGANYPIRLSSQAFQVVDGSVEYFTHPDGAANVRAMIPDAKLLFVFRDPVARAWSDYQMYRKAGTDTGDFTETVRRAMRWLRDPDNDALVASAARNAINPVRYVLCGMYARALERWLEYFPREQCLFLISEEFFADPTETMRTVFQFLELRPYSSGVLPPAREGGYRDWMPAETEAELREFFAPGNAKLAELLGRELPWK